MYPVKVKDYTRMGGWLLLFAVLTALRSVNCLLALVRIPLQLATYGTYGMGLYYVLEGVNLMVGALGAACIVLLAQRKGAALRRVFLTMSAVNIAVFGLELAGLIAFFVQGPVIAESLLATVQQVIYYGIWYLYLLRSRRVAVYFGEAQPMWYECGGFAPYGAQPSFGAPAVRLWPAGPGPGVRCTRTACRAADTRGRPAAGHGPAGRAAAGLPAAGCAKPRAARTARRAAGAAYLTGTARACRRHGVPGLRHAGPAGRVVLHGVRRAPCARCTGRPGAGPGTNEGG